MSSIRIELENPLEVGQSVPAGCLILVGAQQEERFAVQAEICKKQSRVIHDLLEDVEDEETVVPIPVHSTTYNMKLLATWMRHAEVLGDGIQVVARVPLEVGATKLEHVIPGEWDRAFVQQHVCGVELDWHLRTPARLLELLQLATFLGIAALEKLLTGYVSFYLRWAAREAPDVAAAASSMFGRSGTGNVVTEAEISEAEEWIKQQCRDLALKNGR